jgi:hypothetical protein
VLGVCSPGCAIRVGAALPENETGGATLRISADSDGTPDTRNVASLMEELGGTCDVGKGLLELRYAPVPEQGDAHP